MSDLEDAVKGASGEGAVRAAVTAADIVKDAVNALCQAYGDNVVSVFRPGSKNPTSDYDMMVVMEDGINIQGVSEQIKKQLSKYSKEKASKDVHFFIHRRSDYKYAHDFRPPEVVEPASIENWRRLAPTYQFAWEIRTTNPDAENPKEVYVGKEFVREQKPKAENLYANRGEGLELVLTQTRSMLEAFEAPEDKRDSKIAKAVLRATAGIYLARTGKIMATNDELASISLYDKAAGEENKERFLYEIHQKAKKIRVPDGEPGKETFKDSRGECDLNVFKIFETAMKAAVKMASERPDYVLNERRKERMEDYYAHNTEKLIGLMAESTKKERFVSCSPLAIFGAEALLWYVQNGKDDKRRSDASALLNNISKKLETLSEHDFNLKRQSAIYRQENNSGEYIEYALGYLNGIKRIDGNMPVSRENVDKLRKFYLARRAEAASRLLLLAEIKLALGKGKDAEKEYANLEKIKTAPYGFNPDLSNIRARIFRLQGNYAASVREDPINAETWRQWGNDAPEQEKKALYSAIADALERNDIASVAFSARSEEAKEILLRPWQEKLIRVSEDALAMSKKMRADCLGSLNKFEGLEPPTYGFEEMIRLRKEQILLAENFARDIGEFRKCVQPDAYLHISQDGLERKISEFWQQFDSREVQYATVNSQQPKKVEKELGPEMLGLASTSAKRSALHFGYASAATAVLTGASLVPAVPAGLQIYLGGATAIALPILTAIALPILLATGLRLASDMALPRNWLRLKQAFGR